MTNIMTKIENVNGELVVSSRVIAEQFNKQHSHVLASLEQILENTGSTSLIVINEYSVPNQTRKYKEYLLTSEGLGLYLNRIQLLKNKIPESLLEFADMTQFHTYTRFEISFLDMLEEALNELNIVGTRQYNVDKYRVDFYIPNLNICIEYDEEYHCSKTDKDTERQIYITNKLNCNFIRCNYKDSDIKNVMKVIKYILKGDL